MILPQGITTCRMLVVTTLEADQAQLTRCSLEIFWPLDEAGLALDKRLASDDEKLTAIGQAHPECQRLQPIPGLGPVRATALIAAIGDATPCKHGRQLAAWLLSSFVCRFNRPLASAAGPYMLQKLTRSHPETS